MHQPTDLQDNAHDALISDYYSRCRFGDGIGPGTHPRLGTSADLLPVELLDRWVWHHWFTVGAVVVCWLAMVRFVGC